MPSLRKTVRCKPSSRKRKLDLTKQLFFNHTPTTPLPRFVSRDREDFFIDTNSQLDTMPRIR